MVATKGAAAVQPSDISMGKRIFWKVCISKPPTSRNARGLPVRKASIGQHLHGKVGDFTHAFYRTCRTAAPRMASFFKALRARFASESGKTSVSTWIDRKSV